MQKNILGTVGNQTRCHANDSARRRICFNFRTQTSALKSCPSVATPRQAVRSVAATVAPTTCGAFKVRVFGNQILTAQWTFGECAIASTALIEHGHFRRSFLVLRHTFILPHADDVQSDFRFPNYLLGAQAGDCTSNHQLLNLRRAFEDAAFDILVSQCRQHLRRRREKTHINLIRPGASIGRFMIHSLSNFSTVSSSRAGSSRRIWARFISRPSRYISSIGEEVLDMSQFYLNDLTEKSKPR